MGGRTAIAGGLAALAMGGGWAATADTAPAPRKPAPRLAVFGSCDAFLTHVRRHAAAEIGPWGLGSGWTAYRAVAGDGSAVAPATSPSAAAPVEGSGFSGTNLQEAGVDEPDLVKTDGRTIFSIANGALKAVDVTGTTPRELPATDLGGLYATGLILAGDRLLVLGDAGGGRPLPVDVVATPLPGRAVASDIARPAAAWRPATVVVQLDVSDPAHPRTMARLRVDGTLVAARRTGGTVRVVLSSSPTRLPLVSAPGPEGAATRAALRANRRVVARAGAGAWLPRLTLRNAVKRTTTRRPAVGCRAVSRPTDYAGLGMIDVLTLGVTDAMSVLDSDAVMSDGELVYASPERMYVATTRWAEPVGAEPPERGTTLVHALDTSDPARTTYVASGTLRGWLPNAYAMSEKDGLLRAATTEDPPWWNAGTAEPSESFVTVLGERGGRLAEVGRVGGLGRGERIESARFLGDRAYVVTFRRTDPLFAIDLSDPAHPVARGELKIPGFSSYLHPIDAGTLIGVGQAADASGVVQGTQVSLFDVSDLDAPRRIAQRTLDTDWSEAESEPHAFLWWAPASTLVLPAQSYGADGRAAFLGAVGLTVARDTGITPIARVRHPDAGSAWAPVRRALVVGDALYTVSDTGVMASDLATLARRSWTAFR